MFHVHCGFYPQAPIFLLSQLLPKVGEMTITLDYEFCLLCFPIIDKSLDHDTISRNEARFLLRTKLGITPD